MTPAPIGHLPLGGGWEGAATMKKTYIIPAMQAEEAQATQMLAESLGISDTPVDGGSALTKENDDWNIWSDEE